MEGFNLTYKELNEQHEVETEKKIKIDTKIANEEAVLEQEKLTFVEKERDYRFVVGWDEQADDLALYNNKFGRNPKLQAYIAYRIYRKV